MQSDCIEYSLVVPQYEVFKGTRRIRLTYRLFRHKIFYSISIVMLFRAELDDTELVVFVVGPESS